MSHFFSNLSLFIALALSSAAQASPTEDAYQVELDRTRAKIADQVQLAVYDLIDEMVYGWTRSPVFDHPSPVVLAEVSVPVGLGTGLQALVENHLSAVILANPQAQVKLVHCPECTALVVHSGPEGTVVSRGIDNPGVLEQLGDQTGKYALFVDVTAEGAWLVLRARMTRLTPDRPIVWSHTLSTSASTPALLRQPDHLMSASEAREAYLNVLKGRGPMIIPMRLVIRSYARPWNGGVGSAPPPFLWVQTGVEYGVTDARAWTSSFILGGSFIPQAYKGIMAQARVSRLITGRSRSLTHPNLYVFGGVAVMRVWGPATLPFKFEPVTSADVIQALDGTEPRSTFGGLHLGLDLRVGNRIGLSGFIETLPALNRSDNLGSYMYLLGTEFPSMGMEVSVWF